MTESAEEQRVHRLSADFAALVIAFLLVVGFTYSDDIIEFILDVTGHSHFAATDRQWLVLALDLVLILATAALKWWIGADRGSPAAFIRRLLTGWWALGALLVIGAHLVLILTAEHRAGFGDVAAVWIGIAAAVVFVTAMTILMVAALSDGQGSPAWIGPMAIGTFVVQVASVLWYPVINTEGGCAGEVSSTFFSDMTNIGGLVMLAIAVELNYVRRNLTQPDPGRRIAPVLTLLLLALALALAFTMDVKADQEPRCGTAAVWHEYIAFVVNTQALAIGLATIVWLVLADAISD